MALVLGLPMRLTCYLRCGSGPPLEQPMARSKLHRRYTRNPGSLRSNPPLFTELMEFVGPGFASFAGTRFLTYVATTQVGKLKPGLSKHVGAAVSVAAFLSAWFLAHKVKWVEKYHTPITVGAAIATLQSLIQIYLPRIGWMVADATPQLAAPVDMNTQLAQANLTPINDDPNEFTYDDSFDAGRLTPMPGKPPSSSGGTTGDFADLMDDAIGNVNLGVFSAQN